MLWLRRSRITLPRQRGWQAWEGVGSARPAYVGPALAMQLLIDSGATFDRPRAEVQYATLPLDVQRHLAEDWRQQWAGSYRTPRMMGIVHGWDAARGLLHLGRPQAMELFQSRDPAHAAGLLRLLVGPEPEPAR